MPKVKFELEWSELTELTSENVATLKEKGGVYRISHYDPEKKKYYVHYVGQTKNLNDRMQDHANPEVEDNEDCKAYLEQYTCYFKAALLAGSDERDAAERALYDKYKPKANDPTKIPDVEPADINF